jgi:hypothetical protein
MCALKVDQANRRRYVAEPSKMEMSVRFFTVLNLRSSTLCVDAGDGRADMTGSSELCQVVRRFRLDRPTVSLGF